MNGKGGIANGNGLGNGVKVDAAGNIRANTTNANGTIIADTSAKGINARSAAASLSKLDPASAAAMAGSKPVHVHIEPGCQHESVYAVALGPWREWVRSNIFHSLKVESEMIAKLQKAVRTPARDKYFFWSAVLGTHTFFTAFLPLLFWMGYPERARGLLYVVGFGIYFSCVAKDIACTPRPFSPPVTRLSISTHHREYGFPSSHSTNSISIALFAGGWLWQTREIIGWSWMLFGWTVLSWYYATVAGGRIYTGMHSTVDIIGGTLLGTFCWVLWEVIGPTCESWVETGSLWVAAVMVPLTLSLIHYHPETPDDCPCFEDAIAILSVILGIVLGHLNRVRNPVIPAPALWRYGPFWAVVIAVIRIVVGIACIVIWRLVAKTTLLRVLPPIFRMSSQITHVPLPTRKFYTAATAYDTADAPMQRLPSFGQLPLGGAGDAEDADNKNGKSSPTATDQEGGLRMRPIKRNRPRADSFDPVAPNSHRARRETGEQHYDAEVLTKFIVYTGIGMFSSTFVPLLFATVEGYVGLA